MQAALSSGLLLWRARAEDMRLFRAWPEAAASSCRRLAQLGIKLLHEFEIIWVPQQQTCVYEPSETKYPIEDSRKINFVAEAADQYHGADQAKLKVLFETGVCSEV